MTRKKLPENKKSQRGRDPFPWKYCLLTLGCGSILVVGFFLAARQHFSSIDFGIKNSRLRKQIENLEGDKRRFLLAKEIALSPAEIKKVALKIGFRETAANSSEVNRPVNNPKEKQKTPSSEKPKQISSGDADEPRKETVKPEKDIKKDVKKDDGKASEIKDKPRMQVAKK